MKSDLIAVTTAPGGTIEVLGAGLAPGIWPEDFEWEHQLAEHGAVRAAGKLRRNPGQEWIDLQPFTPFELWKGGSRVFNGRLLQTPSERGAADVIGLQLEGYAVGHLKDDKFQKTLVHDDQGAWRDSRMQSAWTGGSFGEFVNTYDGRILLGFPKNMPLALNDITGVSLDLGPFSKAARVIVNGVYSAGDVNSRLLVSSTDNPDAMSTPSGSFVTYLLNAGTPYTLRLSPTTPGRYVHILVSRASGGALPGGFGVDVIVAFNFIRVFASTAYESGDASILKARDAIAAALPYAPKLSQSTAGLATTSFSIPYSSRPAGTVAEFIDGHNGYHFYQWLVDDPADGSAPRLVFRPVPTGPVLQVNVGAHGDAQFADSSKGDGGDVYNRCLVEYTDAGGNSALEERTTTQALGNVFERRATAQPVNGDFETAGGPPPAGWTLIAGNFQRDTTTFDTGVAAGTATTDAGIGVWRSYNIISGLTVGRRYQLQFRIRRTGLWTSSNLVVTLRNTSGIGAWSGFLTVPYSSLTANVWTTLTFDFTAVETSAMLNMETGLGPLGAIIFTLDNVHLRESRPTVVDRQDFLRTMILSSGVRLTQAAAQQIADVYLLAHQTIPLRGTLSGRGAVITTHVGGVPIPGYLLHRYLGQGILINETDPDTGGIGRFGIVSSVKVSDQDDAWEIGIDNNRDYVSAVLNRIGVFEGGGGP